MRQPSGLRFSCALFHPHHLCAVHALQIGRSLEIHIAGEEISRMRLKAISLFAFSSFPPLPCLPQAHAHMDVCTQACTQAHTPLLSVVVLSNQVLIPMWKALGATEEHRSSL